MDKPVLPDYAGGCISNIVPALLDGAVESGSELGSWMPEAALDAGQVVLFVLGKKPGAMALTVMPWRPHSQASARVKLTTAPLLVL